MAGAGGGMREASPMKQSYLTAAFQKTAKDYRAQTETLNSAFGTDDSLCGRLQV